ncbi:hypothetical protein CHS0354_021177, partial [Potamilus streckersoni]
MNTGPLLNSIHPVVDGEHEQPVDLEENELSYLDIRLSILASSLDAVGYDAEVKLNVCFKTKVKGMACQRILIAYHQEGCKTLNFGDTQNCPGQADILTTLKLQETDIEKLDGIQNAGINKYVIYPKDRNTQILKEGWIEVRRERRSRNKVEVDKQENIDKIEGKLTTT